MSNTQIENKQSWPEEAHMYMRSIEADLRTIAGQRDALLAAAKAAEIQLKGYWLDAPNEICKPDIDKAWRLVRNAIEIAEAKR